MKSVLLLIPRGAEVLEMAAFFDVLGWAEAEGSTPIQVVTVGLREEVTCTFGMRVRPDRLLEEVVAEDFDALALPGGFEEYGYYDDAYSSEVGALIREFAARGRPIASICVGALPLGKSGILEGRCATTYHMSGEHRREQLAEFGVKMDDASVVRDDNVVTSTSPATAPDVALLLVEMLTDRENADKVRELMGYPPRG